MILQNNIILYHGSYTEVQRIDLSLCADGKDFGRGFYLTTDYDQAARFVKTAVGKAEKNGMKGVMPSAGFVSFFKYIIKNDASIFEFKDADREWLHCVVAHRRAGLFVSEFEKWQNCDIMAGKIANDTTNTLITNYINGAYGPVESDSADSIVMKLLLPDRLKNQICFRTEKAIQNLMFIESKQVILYETK